jgi:hypothetical protein
MHRTAVTLFLNLVTNGQQRSGVICVHYVTCATIHPTGVLACLQLGSTCESQIRIRDQLSVDYFETPGTIQQQDDFLTQYLIICM